MKRGKSLLIVLLLISTLFVVQYVFILPNVSVTIKLLWNSNKKKVLAPTDYGDMDPVAKVIASNSKKDMLFITYRDYHKYYQCRIGERRDVRRETKKEGEAAFAFLRDSCPAAN